MPRVSSRVSGRARYAFLLTLAACGHLAAVASFLWLPWATGRDVFAGRAFSGAELARLARNLDLLLPQSAGPAATLAALALYAVPATALAGALLVILSRWTDRPRATLRTATAAGLLVTAVSTAVMLLLSAGPAAGDVLNRLPGLGAVSAAIGGLLAACAARAAAAPAAGN